MEVVGELLLFAAFLVLFDKLASSYSLDFAANTTFILNSANGRLNFLSIHDVLNDPRRSRLRVPLSNSGFLISGTWPMTWMTNWTTSTPKCCDASWHCNLMPQPPPPPQARYGVSSLLAVLVSPQVMFLLRLAWGPRIKDITSGVEDISTRKTQLGLEKVAWTTTSTGKRPPTTCLFNEPQVHGRDDDKKKIVDLLLSDESAVIPIVGMGVVGKTTLDRLVYNGDAVRKHFDPKAWVFVSNEFDAVKIAKTILSAISPQTHDSKDFNLLLVELSQSLAGKRFLLVLDDVWNKNYEVWNDLRAPFRGGDKGSKLLVTHAIKEWHQ
ncbi:putative disease resistance RPP13-like protein 1 [Vitis vinifera]|uniref:Putative disease resistance RPP13-like protein 1 n=1 Tax=Vitis vinifera TaxID=29760 RepID=A0A438IJW8_VITVI|nr:putative disease resistance RPP13-like protein 1 [Vitis vinifera]